ncbi:unnamed protein product, partial [Symbiodinium pilosum]
RDKYAQTKKLYWVEVSTDAKFERSKEEQAQVEYECDDAPADFLGDLPADAPEPMAGSEGETPQPRKSKKKKRTDRRSSLSTTPSTAERRPSKKKPSRKHSSAELESALQD